MRRLLCVCILLFYFLVLKAEVRYALIIAIGKYPTDSEWWSIHAANDLSLLKPVLQKQHFSVSQLTDKQATKEGIIREFQALTKQLKKGDIVFIHFSCHGQQMEDDNGDEPDEWDEALIPYDAGLTYEKGFYEGENHLRDDELNNYLMKIRKKIGSLGMVFVTLDACHSASGTRGDEEEEQESVRGTARRFSPSGKTFRENTQDRKHYSDTPLLRGKELASLTVVSACKSYQVNQEIKVHGKYYGSLSYSLAQVLQYESLLTPVRWIPIVLREIKRKVKQNPVVESTLLTK